LGNNLTLSNGGGTVAVPSGADGNGIYGGSGTLIVNDTTIVTVLPGSALQVGNMIQSPSETTTIFDSNKWTTFNGWDRATYSYGGFSGYYWTRGNGTAANKLPLNVNDELHEWAFSGQKSSTEDNYALILKPTVDEITGGNNWGRLDFNGADFATWLSLRRTGIRAGTSVNYTTFANQRPTSAASFWQHNTDGTGEYKTPGAMTVTNPVGGSNTLQAALDSLNAIAGGTWLKPELEAGDVTIESDTSTLTFNAIDIPTGINTTIRVNTPLATDERVDRILYSEQPNGDNFRLALYDAQYEFVTTEDILIRSKTDSATVSKTIFVIIGEVEFKEQLCPQRPSRSIIRCI
jgi:hypothetical protein